VWVQEESQPAQSGRQCARATKQRIGEAREEAGQEEMRQGGEGKEGELEKESGG